MEQGGGAAPIGGGGGALTWGGTDADKAFLQTLGEFHHSRDNSVKLERVVRGVRLNLKELYDAVQEQGGSAICNSKRGHWAAVGRKLYGDEHGGELGGQLKGIFDKVLKEYEKGERRQRALAAQSGGGDGGGGGGAGGKEGGDEGGEAGADAEELSSSVIEERSAARLAEVQARVGKLISNNVGIRGHFDEVGELMEDANRIMAKAQDDDYYSVSFVGTNGIGKSTAIQATVQVAMVSPDEYERLKRVEDEDVEGVVLAKALAKRQRERQQQGGGGGGGGAQEIEEDEEDEEDEHVHPEPSQPFFTSEGHMKDEDARRTEEDGQRRIIEFCEGKQMRVNTFPQFLLPQPRINDATTSHCIRFRWSKTVHALVVFHSLEEVRQLIVGFDWKYHHEAEKGNTLTDEEKIEYGYMKELYKTVTEAQLATSAAAVVGGGQKEEDDEEDDETRQQALTQVLAGITGPACPTVNLQHVDVHPDIKALLEKSYRLFLGRGMHLLDDRVYVRQALEQQLEGPFQTLIKDVYVFAPSRLLQGRIELVDTPGLNDGDAVRTHCIVQQLKSTDHIVLCAKKSLKTDEKTLDVLQEQKVWERLFQDNLRPGRGDLRLSVLLLPEAVAQLSGKEMIKSDTRKREQQESITENLMTLRERLLMAARALFTDVPEQKVAEYLGGWRIEVVSCYPLLYLSTMVNASFLWEEPSARNTLLDRTDGKKLVALLVSPNRGHLKDIEALHARATRRLECLEERNGAQGPLPEPVLNLAKRLTGGGDGATLRDNRLQEIKTAIVEDDAFKFAKGLLQPDPPAAGVAQTLDETLPGGVAKAKAWLLEVMEKKGNGRRKSPLRNFVNRCSPSLVQTILGHESQAIAEAKQQLSEQMVTARDDLLACSTTTLQHHLEQCFANCIDLESPDGARLKSRVKYFVQGSRKLNEHMQELFRPFIGEGLDKTIKELVDAKVKSFFPLAPPATGAISDAVETKLGQMEFAFSSIGEELGKKWGTAFSKSTVKLLTHATKPLIKTLFNSFMRGTGEENLFGGDIVGKLISAVKLYTTFCEGELAQLEEEYKAHQKGLHAQLQIDRTMAYFLGRIVQACGDNGLERLGRNLINTRCPPTACLYKPGVMLHRPEQLQQRLLHEQHGRPHSSWGPNEQLVGPAVFLRGLPLFVNGTLLNNGGTNTDLLLSLAAQIGLRAEGDSDKEALAEAVVGSLIVKKFALAKAGQQTALTDESLARLRGDPVELLKVFASLHGKQVDVFVAEGKQVVAIYRISPPSVSALSASYKVCWSREEGFGPATLERQAPTQRRVRFAEGTKPPAVPASVSTARAAASTPPPYTPRESAGAPPASPGGGAFLVPDPIGFVDPTSSSSTRSRSRSASSGRSGSHSRPASGRSGKGKGDGGTSGGGGGGSKNNKRPASSLGGAGSVASHKQARQGDRSTATSSSSRQSASSSRSSAAARSRGGGGARASSSASAAAVTAAFDDGFRIPRTRNEEAGGGASPPFHHQRDRRDDRHDRRNERHDRHDYNNKRR